MMPVIVFAKAPVPGRVKTRLAQALGPTAAARVYGHMLARTVEVACAAAPGATWLFASPDATHPSLMRLIERHRLLPAEQRGSDLGLRMLDAMRRVLVHAEGCVLVGADCPELTVDDLREARRALEAGVDLVLGPSADGGYVLIALRRAHPLVFCDVPWSTARVAAVTRSRSEALGWRRHELRMLRDIDEPRDLSLIPRCWQWSEPAAAPIF